MAAAVLLTCEHSNSCNSSIFGYI